MDASRCAVRCGTEQIQKSGPVGSLKSTSIQSTHDTCQQRSWTECNAKPTVHDGPLRANTVRSTVRAIQIGSVVTDSTNYRETTMPCRNVDRSI